MVTGRNEWQVFRDWLKVCYKRAKRARLAAQIGPRPPGQSMPKVQPAAVTSSRTGIICSRCRETGHKREDCPQPATGASINWVQVEYDHQCD